jgi:hypothetical protein
LDNDSFDQLLADRQERNFWLKPIGPPHYHPDYHKEDHRTWEQDPVEIHFARRPGRIEKGDILIAYRIRIGKVLYVAECLTAPELASDEQVRQEPYRGQFRWSFQAHNFTREYGRHWERFNIRPFPLARKYNEEHSDEPASLGAIMHGGGQALIPRGFAVLLIKKIQACKMNQGGN